MKRREEYRAVLLTVAVSPASRVAVLAKRGERLVSPWWPVLCDGTKIPGEGQACFSLRGCFFISKLTCVCVLGLGSNR